jgi:hypothetical protein
VNDPVKLIDCGDPVIQSVLRSAEVDRPSSSSLRRVIAAVGTVAGIAAGHGTAAGLGATGPAALAGSSVVAMVLKWAGIGVLGGVIASSSPRLFGSLWPAQTQKRVEPGVAEGSRHSVHSPRESGSTEPQPAALPAVPGTEVPDPPSRLVTPSNTQRGGSWAPSPTTSIPARLTVDWRRTRPEPTKTTTTGNHPGTTTDRIDAAVSESSGSAKGPSLPEEVAALDRVNKLLARHAAGQALTALHRYQNTFRDGSLAPEATVLRVRALLALGQRAQAESLARAFVQQDPTSPHAAVLRSLVQH